MSDVALVTGCAGFLGRHVCQHLVEKGVTVIGVDDLSGGFKSNIPEGVVFYKADICDEDLLDSIFKQHQPRWVYHLAAYAAEGLSPFIRKFNYTNNVVGSAVVTNCAIRAECEGIVFTSSIATFGHQAPPFHESTPERGDDPYAIAKIATSADLKDAENRFGLKHIIFKPFNIYGPFQNMGDPFRNLIGIHMNQCLKQIPRTIFGDGEQVRSFSEVSDVAPAIAESVFRQAWGNTFCIGGSRPYSVNYVSKLISKEMGVSHDVTYLPPRKEAVSAYCSTIKAKEWFGDLINDTSIEEGLPKMALWAKRVGVMEPTPSPKIEVFRGLPWISM